MKNEEKNKKNNARAENVVTPAEQIRAADKYTIEKDTPSREFMRRAAHGIFDAVNPRN